MQDQEIVELFRSRDETALSETSRKYAKLCKTIAFRILGNREDAEEVFSDVLQKAWTGIPPQNPAHFKAWLCRVTRNLAIDRSDFNQAQKRTAERDFIFSELDEIIPARDDVQKAWENSELSRLINNWLKSLPKEEQKWFVKRYFFGNPLKEIAKDAGVKPAKMAQTMYRLRNQLKNVLEKEGVRL